MMRRWVAAYVVVATAIASSAGPNGAGAQNRRSIVTASLDEATLTQAFEAAKAGDYGPLSALPTPSSDAVPAIAVALSDDSEIVRREAVTLLGLINEPAAAPALARALSDPVDDVATRAAAALYRFGPVAIEADPSVGERLRDVVDKGFTAGGAILTLAHAKAEAETIATLRSLRKTKGDSLSEVVASSPTVPVALMVDVSLAKLGDNEAEDRLAAVIAKEDLNTSQFLLSVLREIDSTGLIQTLSTATLADTRPVAGDAPAGAETGLRLADLAATRLTARFNLPVDLDDTADMRLPDEIIQAVKAALDRHLAKVR